MKSVGIRNFPSNHTHWRVHMCWRDDVPDTRHCSSCGRSYYGDLGHRGCPAMRSVSKGDLKQVPVAMLRNVSDKLIETLGSEVKAEGWLLSYNRALGSFPFETLLVEGGEELVMQVIERVNHGVHS